MRLQARNATVVPVRIPGCVRMEHVTATLPLHRTSVVTA